MRSMDPLDSLKGTLTSGKDVMNNKAGSNGMVKRGSKLKPPSKIINTAATTVTTTKTTTTKTRQATTPKQTSRYAQTPRPSATDRLSQHRMSHSTMNSHRPAGPRSPNQRHQTTPRAAPRQAIAIATAKPRKAASSSKSSMARLQQEFDTLKLKYDASEQRIADQHADLIRLKLQLSASPPSTPAPTPLRPNITDLAVHKKGTTIQLEKPQLNLEDTTNDTSEPWTRVKPSMDDDAGSHTLGDRQCQDQDLPSNPSITLVEKIASDKEQAISHLLVNEKELESLRSQIQEKTAIDDSLQKQLYQQKQHYEDILQQHERTFLDKDRLLQEQAQFIADLKATHDDTLRRLQADHSSKILKLTQHHQQEILQLRQEQHHRPPQQVDLETELEKVLYAFEQEKHNHKASALVTQVSHGLESLDRRRLVEIGASQGHTSTRYLPTQAVSWPSPPPLSILRKTAPRSHRSTASSFNLTPSDPKHVQLYISTVSGNPNIKKQQHGLQELFHTQHIAFETMDVAASGAVLQHMKCHGGTDLPQVFVGGDFRGMYADVMKHMDQGTLDQFLMPAQVSGLSSSSSSSSSSSTSSSHPGYALTEDDEAILKALEHEIEQGNIDLSDPI